MLTEMKIFERAAYGNDTSWEMNTESFDWNPGVFLVGATALYNKNGSDEIIKYLESWFSRHIKEVYITPTINSTAPMTALIEMYKRCENSDYLKVIDDIAKRIITEAPLTADGGLEHTVTENADFNNQMWADTLFMAVVFVAKYGKMTGKREYIEFAEKQLLYHHRMLKDKKTGLFFHGWDGNGRNHMSGALWARANAWVTLSTVLIFRELPEQFEGKAEIEKSLMEQLEGLKKYQHSNGGFSTVIDRTESYCETSATAGIAAGIFAGIKSGIIPQKYMDIADGAYCFVKENIDAAGNVLSVSTGTPIMHSVEDYMRIKTCSTLYGQGLALIMYAEKNS